MGNKQLEDLKDELADWRMARRALAQGKSYTINGRTLTRSNYSEVRQAILDIEAEITNIEDDTKSYMRVWSGVPRRG